MTDVGILKISLCIHALIAKRFAIAILLNELIKIPLDSLPPLGILSLVF